MLSHLLVAEAPVEPEVALAPVSGEELEALGPGKAALELPHQAPADPPALKSGVHDQAADAAGDSLLPTAHRAHDFVPKPRDEHLVVLVLGE